MQLAALHLLLPSAPAPARPDAQVSNGLAAVDDWTSHQQQQQNKAACQLWTACLLSSKHGFRVQTHLGGPS